MNHATLAQKLQTLASYPQLNAETVAKFGTILEQLDDWELLRLNPLIFAARYDFPPQEIIDIFVHGAKIGLLDFSFQTICTCGVTEYNFTVLHELPEEGFYCSLCDKPVIPDLDDRVEVLFNLNPSVKKLAIDPYADIDTYLKYFHSPNLEFSPQHYDFINATRCAEFLVAADTTHVLTLNALPNSQYRLTSLGFHSLINLHISENISPTTQVFTIDLLPSGLPHLPIHADAGEITLKITNQTSAKVGLGLYLVDKAKQNELNTFYPPKIKPYLTAKILLNNHSFRTLFRTQPESNSLRLNIRSLTILFTDLKGSTELYDQLGDTQAYSLVQRHFQILTEAVQQGGGAIIKTIGDAIMATFATPREGMQAAIAMMEGIEKFNYSIDQKLNLGLKIGLHTGSALVVNLDERLDYFGQNVNIAARVQGLANSGEIWITEPVYEEDAIATLLEAKGYQTTQHAVTLKGVEKTTIVFQCQSK